MTRDKVVDRVRKLLRLANGSNGAEAEQALLQAQRLMAANGLAEGEIGDLSETELEPIIEVQTESVLRRGSHHLGGLASVIAGNFRCKAYYANGSWAEQQARRLNRQAPRTRLTFLGRKADVEIAVDVYKAAREAMEAGLVSYLAGEKDRLFRQAGIPKDARWAKSSTLNPVKSTFRHGFVSGLEAKFASQVRSSGLQLVIVPDAGVQQAIADLGLGRAPQAHGMPGGQHAHFAGELAGRDFKLEKKLNDPGTAGSPRLIGGPKK